MLQHIELLARQVGSVHRLAIDILIELLSVRGIAVYDRLPVERYQRHHGIGGDLQGLEADVGLAIKVTNEGGTEAVAELGRHDKSNLRINMLREQSNVKAHAVHSDAGVLGKEIARVVEPARVGID